MSPRASKIKQGAVVFVLGIIAVASVIGVSFLTRELAVRWILSELRASPDYFGEILERQDQFAVREALERYLLTPSGRDAFMRQSFTLGVNEGLKSWIRRGRTRENRGLLRITPTRVDLEPGGPHTGLGENPKRRGLVSLLPLLENETITVEDYPDVAFTVLSQLDAIRVFRGPSESPGGRAKSDGLPDYIILLEVSEHE